MAVIIAYAVLNNIARKYNDVATFNEIIMEENTYQEEKNTENQNKIKYLFIYIFRFLFFFLRNLKFFY